ncbi:MAG: SRPBCC family protein [Planctomycetaceae bacterium]|nr:SRPBCC family protein [Planctomycetaceae bacterium]
MAIKTEASIEIDRPIDQVFDYTTNHVAEWSDTVIEDEPLETMPDGGVGSTFRCVTANNGQRMEMQGTVTQYEPPVKSAVHLESGVFDIHALYLFEDLGRSTRVTQVSVVTAKGFLFRLMFRLVGVFARKSGCQAALKELQNLKRCLEADDRP